MPPLILQSYSTHPAYLWVPLMGTLRPKYGQEPLNCWVGLGGTQTNQHTHHSMEGAHQCLQVSLDEAFPLCIENLEGVKNSLLGICSWGS